ncbi:hypothetical protein TBR22_A40330 [Luteitalea sp. TBR-22]|uniref:DUF167 domain-containing protein n=1 Tax=Luteitalea sp. TBR-22 TaxID=2802971 RepID=UPI001AF20793|nr:DUF167 domain-containing protein [Luteitalea sp. TBR-22]BCS34807.1 hypothetical protein TBR22_A40330 [Luteitalea sp. TBR-22]
MITDVPGGVVIAVRVVPRAGRSGLAGTREDAVLVRLAAAPVDGAANAELIEVLADAFGVPRRQVSLVAGDRARQKRVRIDGLTRARAAAVVAASGSRG